MDVGIEDLLVCVTWKRQPRMESRLQTNVALTHAQLLAAGATHLADLLSGICLCWWMADGAEALAHYPGRITLWTPSRLAQGFSLGTQQVLIGGRQVGRLSKCRVQMADCCVSRVFGTIAKAVIDLLDLAHLENSIAERA